MKYINSDIERIGFDFYCDIANNIVKAREDKGWTQEQLAKASGISKSRISNMENVKVRFEKEVIEQLSKALDVSADWLINAVPQCTEGQECLYLWWTEGHDDFKLYIKGTSLREAYDDGDFYVTSGSLLCSRTARNTWSRYIASSEPGKISGGAGDIVKTFTYDTVDRAELCKQAVTELKKIRDPEITYEIELNYLPDGVKIGDTVTLIDEEAELYITARILKLEESEYDDKRTATLGEHVLKKSGVAQEISNLAKQFESFSKNRPFYTWTAYADDALGTGISLDSEGKNYIGTATNKTSAIVDISDPSTYTWIKVKGETGAAGSDAILIAITTSAGNIFRNSSGSTILTAHVYKAGGEVTGTALTALGTIKWYKDGGTTAVGTGASLTVNAADVNSKSVYEARLEA